jgi:hypothetical protein
MNDHQANRNPDDRLKSEYGAAMTYISSAITVMENIEIRIKQ